MSASRPNILFLTIDQHRWDFVEGGVVSGLRTPTMARLREEGTTFMNAVSNCPICMPTRFTWMHGLYASQASAGLLENAADWPTGLPTLPGALREVGYHTSLVGKLHRHAGLARRDVVADVAGTCALGFDDVMEVSGKSLALWYDCEWTRHLEARGERLAYVRDVTARGDELGGSKSGAASVLAEEDSMDAFIARHACDWLGSYDGEKPFFLHASLCGPHFPVDPPERFAARYEADDMPPPEGVNDPEAVREWRERRAGYAALVEHVDFELGRILDALDRTGKAAETLVVFGSDHGEMIGHRNRANKGTPYETSVRTPVTFRLPGVVAAGRVVGDLLEAVDLPLTMVEAGGIEVPGGVFRNSPGRSAWGRVTGRTEEPVRTHAYSEAGVGERAWRLCRDERYKLVVRGAGEDELYDMASDPWEMENRIDDPALAEVRSRLRRELLRIMARSLVAVERGERVARDDWWRAVL